MGRGTEHVSVVTELGGGYETYISVVTKLRGTKHISLVTELGGG